MRHRLVGAVVLLVGAGAITPSTLHAQNPTVIKTDSSWGRTSTVLIPTATDTMLRGNRGASYRIPGAVYTITQAQGKVAGANLFHSFESFGIGHGDAALFTTSSQLNNVISRVTGASPSTIEGLLMLQPMAGSSPNLFFINPAGVTFGAGAQIDVPGAFHVGTANQLRFADGTLFKAGNGSDSTLSMAAPAAFGFLGSTRAGVGVRDGTVLSTLPGKPISVLAGDVQISQGGLMTRGGGDIRIAVVGNDAIDVPLTGSLPPLHGTLNVVNAGFVLATTLGARDGGNIKVSAGDINIDGKTSGEAFTGMSAVAVPGSDANAGNVLMTASRRLFIGNGGLLTSDSYGSGNAGDITIHANSMTLDSGGDALGTDSQGTHVQTGVANSTYDSTSPAAAGNIVVSVSDHLSILNGAEILSSTMGTGKAKSIRVHAGEISIDEQDSPDFTGVNSQANGGSGRGADIEVSVKGQLLVLNGGAISAATFSPGDAGSVQVSAEDIRIDEQLSPFFTGISSQAQEGSSGRSGNVAVSASGQMLLLNGGTISSESFSTGTAGSTKVSARSLTIDGQQSPFFTGISSQSGALTSDAGQLEVVVAENLSLMSGGQISSATFSDGNSGAIKVSAESLTINGQARTGLLTGILTNAVAGSLGDAGTLEVKVRGTLLIINGGIISSDTRGAGAAGSIKVNAGRITLDSQDNKGLTGIFSLAEADSSGNRKGGRIEVSTAGPLVLLNSAQINSSTLSTSDAGSISVAAAAVTIQVPPDSLCVAGSCAPPAGIFSGTGGSGAAGQVEVSVGGNVSLINAGTIGSSTSGIGNAGTVKVSAANISIDGQDDSIGNGIQAVSFGAHAGNAGDVVLSATGNLIVIRGGFISSSTLSPTGHSGSVTIDAESVLVDGARTEISASAYPGSSGQTGSLSVNARNAIVISNGGILSIRNDATAIDPSRLPPTVLTVTAPNITLKGAQITAESTGNVSASDIDVRFSDRLILDPSRITTSANQGNGGSIRIDGGNVLFLDRSQITTSVSGRSGNGGDIRIHANALALRSGFIQANTAGVGARGGDVAIDVQALLASGNRVAVGGSTAVAFEPDVFGLNVIQAAAPTGVSGRINIAGPLDISGSLRGLSGALIDFHALGQDLCRVGAGSSLTPLGRGGLRPSASGMIRPEGDAVAEAQEQNGGPQLRDPLAHSGISRPASYRCEN